jgi:DNA primase
VSDQYEQVRSLPFPALAAALGLDMTRFKRRKADWQGYCPIHQSKSNNNCFAYNDDGRFHCFSCDAKGRGAIDLAKLVKNIGFKEAVEFLGSVPPPDTKTEPTRAPVASDGALQPLAKDTWRKLAVACPWLEERIPDAGIRERYGVFCYNNPARKSAYSGRVMLPVKDSAGVLYGYLGRDTSGNPDNPKYLFPKNLPKSRFLFGAAELVAGTFGPVPLKRVYLVESPFCVMKFAMYGLPAVAAYGWSIAEEQLSLLCTLAKGIVYLPDRNKAESCAETLLRISRHLWVKAPPLPAACEDPESLTKEVMLAL